MCCWYPAAANLRRQFRELFMTGKILFDFKSSSRLVPSKAQRQQWLICSALIHRRRSQINSLLSAVSVVIRKLCNMKIASQSFRTTRGTEKRKQNVSTLQKECHVIIINYWNENEHVVCYHQTTRAMFVLKGALLACWRYSSSFPFPFGSQRQTFRFCCSTFLRKTQTRIYFLK